MFAVSFAFRMRVKVGKKMRLHEKGNNRNDKSAGKEEDGEYPDLPMNDSRSAVRFQVTVSQVTASIPAYFSPAE